MYRICYKFKAYDLLNKAGYKKYPVFEQLYQAVSLKPGPRPVGDGHGPIQLSGASSPSRFLQMDTSSILTHGTHV